MRVRHWLAFVALGLGAAIAPEPVHAFEQLRVLDKTDSSVVFDWLSTAPGAIANGNVSVAGFTTVNTHGLMNFFISDLEGAHHKFHLFMDGGTNANLSYQITETGVLPPLSENAPLAGRFGPSDDFRDVTQLFATVVNVGRLQFLIRAGVDSVNAVEPASLTLLASGAVLLGIATRRRRKAQA